jgi:hypothetical protein
MRTCNADRFRPYAPVLDLAGDFYDNAVYLDRAVEAQCAS